MRHSQRCLDASFIYLTLFYIHVLNKIRARMLLYKWVEFLKRYVDINVINIPLDLFYSRGKPNLNV